MLEKILTLVMICWKIRFLGVSHTDELYLPQGVIFPEQSENHALVYLYRREPHIEELMLLFSFATCWIVNDS